MKDYYRQVAHNAVHDWMTTNHTNAIATGHVWHAVNLALNAYEDELSRQSETRVGYAVVLDNHPMLVVTTRRQACQQRRIMRRLLGPGKWQVRRTQIAVD